MNLVKISLFGLILGLFACGNASTETQTSASDSTAQTAATAPASTEVPKVEWDVKKVDDEMNPKAFVAIKINGKSFPIDTAMGDFQTGMAADFESQQVPKEAWGAGGSFWAGLGVYYYVVVDAQAVKVFARFEEESYMGDDGEMIDAKPEWKLWKEFPASSW